MFKVNNKDTRTTLFHTLSRVFIVNFKQVNDGWEDVNDCQTVNLIY